MSNTEGTVSRDINPNIKPLVSARLVVLPDKSGLVIDFGTPISFLQLSPEEGRQFARGLLAKIEELDPSA